MHGVVLDSVVTNLLKYIDPLDDLAEQISKDNGLATLSRISPSLLDSLLF
jgi:hypothetical protein